MAHAQAGAPLAGRVALVTGGAGGLGAAICRALAGAGAAVVVGYHRSAGPAQALAAELPPAVAANGARGPAAHAVQPAALPNTALPHAALAAPVTDSAAMARLAQQLRERWGRCDILVNCAGTTRFVPHADLDALDDDLIDQVLATNVRGPLAAVRALKPLLTAPRPWGDTALVVNISSIAAVTAMGSNVAYCASKAALDNITRSLARALAPAVRVVSVSPGLCDTDFVKAMDPVWRDEQAARTPLQRLVHPDEVAAAVLAAATLLRAATGCVVAVDGGRPLS